MTQVLLVGTDGSECSIRSVEYASKWAKVANSHLYVAHVIHWSPYSFSTPAENEERHKRKEQELERAQSHIIDPIVTDLRGKGVDAEGVIRHGHPAETLSELANELDATNIIIGRKGQSLIRAKLFGSIASTLVQISDHPVTVVP